MKSEWKKVRLGDVATVKGGKRLPKGKKLQNIPTSHPYIRIRDLNDKRIVSLTEDFEYIDEETFKTISKYTVNSGDIIISIVASIGMVTLIDESLDKASLTENCAKIVDIKNVDKKFLCYYLKSDVGQNEIKRRTVGAVQAKLPLKNILSITIMYPPYPEQRAIAATLSCLDDKIELNNKINANLEAQAQAIFKSWFVDFEPFRDGEFIDSELGPIPKGWRVGQFTDIVDILGGGTPKTNNSIYWNGEIPFFTPKDVNKVYTISTEKSLSSSGVDSCNTRIYPINTVFITARGTVGKITLAGIPMAMNQSCYALRGKEKYNQYFVYGMAQKLVNSLRHKSSGAVFNAIVTRDFDSEFIIIPENSIINHYNNTISPLFELILQNTKQSGTLATLRDALLPKLMSGKIESPFKERLL